MVGAISHMAPQGWEGLWTGIRWSDTVTPSAIGMGSQLKQKYCQFCLVLKCRIHFAWPLVIEGAWCVIGVSLKDARNMG